MKLTPQEDGFLKLLLRSPDIGDGWRRVSGVVRRLVDGFGRPELLEWEPSADGGGRVRLTERGTVVVDYI